MMHLRERLDAKFGPDVAAMQDQIDAMKQRADARDQEIAAMREQLASLQYMHSDHEHRPYHHSDTGA